jgi:hypothetical protein
VGIAATRRLVIALAITAAGCAVQQPTAITARQIAVLPPCDADGRPLPPVGDAGGESLTEVLTVAAGAALASNGFAVMDPDVVGRALHGGVPASAADAAALAQAGGIDAAALFIRLEQWVPVPESTMRIDAVLVGLDLTLLDPASGATLWHAHRTIKPVRVFGSLIIGQAYVVAAESVMKEMLAPLRPSTGAQ